MRTAVISQPTYLPWLGYFRIMKEADVYVFLDSVQFERRSWQCRNYIKSPKGPFLLTVPTYHSPQLRSIEATKIDNTKPWRRQHWNALTTFYARAPYFDLYSSFFEAIYKRRWIKLCSLNIHIIKFLASQLGLAPLFLRSSQMNIEGKRTRLLLNICRKVKADRYVSSIGAREYMREDGAEELFANEGIKVQFLEYGHPNYPQLFGDFVSNLSSVDCLYNCGPDFSRIIFEKGSAVLRSFLE
jgi:hypothetical protein